MAARKAGTARPLLQREGEARNFDSYKLYAGASFAVGVVIILCLMKVPRAENSKDTVSTNTGSLSVGCQQNCSAPFGNVLGIYNGVPAMSNCNSDSCTAELWNTVKVEDIRIPAGRVDPHAVPPIYGMQWQCVEYARRYWMLRGTPQPATFGSVDGAADIWDLKDVQLLNGQKRKPLLKYHNGNATSANSKPRVGDLLIYPRQPNGFPYGHVAVVAGVTGDRMFVAEQNWENTAWPGPYHNYSRVLNLSCNPNGTACTVREKDNVTVQGWVRYE
ncbi:D-alanyl-glycyl endopeptidase-like protein [Trypanosoma brucei brucei TREU927]|uniref:D-alanyl-glycyl endopeptidase-like protein n=1 Tax=Trypanosoma brucei brucei (strain 927/4 GUTat10.1) TaxID=185431 RepID=Q586Y2_TRYB2|nr:D-alanyl-glycyl endopeptidase-like protein [Trypanosoma brucei brucei TREU927]AAQ15801.1 D-alanyl-glycyl endopeptidase-like protein [Trypanosoma brucei brucei TREU927]AAX79609.1 D-alanyl-glycyl endopeptidase-like protein [Trypanosoma brucei]